MGNKLLGRKWGLSRFWKIDVISWRKDEIFSWSIQEKEKSKTLKELIKLITPPKGVRWRDGNQQSIWPIDEGFDLFDCDGEQMQNDEINFEPKSDD